MLVYFAASSSGILPDFQFQTQQLDSGSNLYFLRARYYDPELGRFISRDPIKGTLTNPQSQNPYAYSLNNPVNYSDPSGEQTVVTEFIKLCARAVTTVGTKASSLLQRSAQNPVVQTIEYHGNDLRNPATTYGYTLRNATGEVIKFGETISPGTRYPQSWLDENNLILQVETTGSKLEMHNWQNDKILQYLDDFGLRPPLNKSNF